MSVIQWPMGLSRWSLVLFFMMAGYFGALLHARWGTARFVRDRLLRIGVPLLVGLLTIVPLSWLIIHRSSATPGLFPQGALHLWFIYYVAWLLVVALLFSILLGLYELVVRHSVVGRVLNGPRPPRGWGLRRRRRARVPEGASG